MVEEGPEKKYNSNKLPSNQDEPPNIQVTNKIEPGPLTRDLTDMAEMESMISEMGGRSLDFGDAFKKITAKFEKNSERKVEQNPKTPSKK